MDRAVDGREVDAGDWRSGGGGDQGWGEVQDPLLEPFFLLHEVV